MELVLDTDYKYDSINRYYYLTDTGAKKITGINDFNIAFSDVERRLKKQGQLLKSLMVMCPNDIGLSRISKKDFIEYTQYTYEEKRKDVLYMLGELAEASYDDDIDRIIYEAKKTLTIKELLPITIVQRGYDSGMMDFANVNFVVPEDEYQVGY